MALYENRREVMGLRMNSHIQSSGLPKFCGVFWEHLAVM